MPSAFDYREMALECLKEAAATKDDRRKRTLTDLAKLYTQTAINIGQSDQDNSPAPTQRAVYKTARL